MTYKNKLVNNQLEMVEKAIEKWLDFNEIGGYFKIVINSPNSWGSLLL